ncbi:MAG: GH116 family glycosyl hydrolase, partial [Bryobacteraceae bacterium]
NLFNGEYYIQRVRGVPKDQVLPVLRSKMGSEDTENPEYQLGEGCLVDQLVGQYLADVAGLGPLLDESHIRSALASIWRYNLRRSLDEHESVQRTYALNEEGGLLVCDYGKAKRPRIPFPYYAEVWTGLEYAAAAQMIFAGMVKEGVECFRLVRSRHDGEKRNPWDEPECGHHYARAMSAWSGILALSGFRYDGLERRLAIAPALRQRPFHCFWATGTGWGSLALRGTPPGASLTLDVLHGSLALRSVEIEGAGAETAILANDKALWHQAASKDGRTVFRFEELRLNEGDSLRIEVQA